MVDSEGARASQDQEKKPEVSETPPDTSPGAGAGTLATPEENKEEQSGEEWEKENTDKPTPAKKEETSAIPKAEPEVTSGMSSAEVEAAKKVANAANRQLECNKCPYDKKFKHNVFKCEKFPTSKKECGYLKKYVDMNAEQRAEYTKKRKAKTEAEKKAHAIEVAQASQNI